MKIFLNIVTALVVVAAGVAMCILSGDAGLLGLIVRIVGGAFVAAGVLNVVSELVRKQSNAATRTVGWIAATGGVILGAVMLIAPDVFVPYMSYLFGILLILGALISICTMGFSRLKHYPGWFYVAPVVMLLGGVILLCTESIRDNEPVVVAIGGVGLIIYGICMLLMLGGTKKIVATDTETASDSADSKPEVQDIRAEEVTPEKLNE